MSWTSGSATHTVTRMNDLDLTRRGFLTGPAALVGAGAIACQPAGSPAVPRVAGPPPALVVMWLFVGPAVLFYSARSFLANGAFGFTADNVRDVGNDLLVDRDSLGALPPIALAHMASINFHHGVVRPHDHARAAVLVLV